MQFIPPPPQLLLVNVSVAYINPSELDTCQQYTERTVFAMQQLYGVQNTTIDAGRTTGNVAGPLTVDLLVIDGANNATGAFCSCFGSS